MWPRRRTHLKIRLLAFNIFDDFGRRDRVCSRRFAAACDFDVRRFEAIGFILQIAEALACIARSRFELVDVILDRVERLVQFAVRVVGVVERLISVVLRFSRRVERVANFGRRRVHIVGASFRRLSARLQRLSDRLVARRLGEYLIGVFRL